MRRLVITFVIGHLRYAEHALPTIRAYCSATGADFMEVKWFPEMDTEFHGNPNWSCVQHLKNFAAQDYYQEIMLLDSDVVIMPWCPNLFDMPGEVVCVRDTAWPEKDARYATWLRRNYPKSSELAQLGGGYFNAGMLLFRLDGARKLDLGGPYPDDYANDQDFLNMRVGEAGLCVNWLGFEFNQRDLEGRPREVMQANNILHFVGAKKNLIHQYIP